MSLSAAERMRRYRAKQVELASRVSVLEQEVRELRAMLEARAPRSSRPQPPAPKLDLLRARIAAVPPVRPPSSSICTGYRPSTSLRGLRVGVMDQEEGVL
jgi:hypothetical protein